MKKTKLYAALENTLPSDVNPVTVIDNMRRQGFEIVPMEEQACEDEFSVVIIMRESADGYIDMKGAQHMQPHQVSAITDNLLQYLVKLRYRIKMIDKVGVVI